MPNNVDPNAMTHLSAPAGKVPIIVVPGILGSRLMDSSGTLVWNPMGVPADSRLLDPFYTVDPGDNAADAKRLSDLQPLLPAKLQSDWNTSSWSLVHRAINIDGFFQGITHYYDKLCFALHEELPDLFAARHAELTAKVYMSGYDWRQSVGDSAHDQLAPTVARALAETGASKVVLVAHSQGGLVSRYYARQIGGGRVGAFIALASPHLGAVQPFTRLKQGVVDAKGYDDVVTWGLTKRMGLTQWETAYMLRLFPSMYQLMACRHFFAIDPAKPDEQWLRYDESMAGYPYVTTDGEPRGPSPVGTATYYDLYAGLTEHILLRQEAIAKLDIAGAVHEALTSCGKPFMPPNSFCVYTDDMDTQRRVFVKNYGRLNDSTGNNEYLGWPDVEVGAMGKGDGSVPMESACPSNPSNPFVATKAIQGVDHGSVPNYRPTIDAVLGWIVDLYAP